MTLLRGAAGAVLAVVLTWWLAASAYELRGYPWASDARVVVDGTSHQVTVPPGSPVWIWHRRDVTAPTCVVTAGTEGTGRETVPVVAPPDESQRSAGIGSSAHHHPIGLLDSGSGDLRVACTGVRTGTPDVVHLDTAARTDPVDPRAPAPCAWVAASVIALVAAASTVVARRRGGAVG